MVQNSQVSSTWISLERPSLTSETFVDKSDVFAFFNTPPGLTAFVQQLL